MATSAGQTADAGATPTQRQLSEESNARIRETVKWLIASYAAVGAALIAGSQLSSIGKLCAGCGRFWVAVLGILLGIAGVAWAIWLGVQVLVSEKKTLSGLKEEWKDRTSAVHEFFARDVVFFQGFTGFANAADEETQAYASYDEARFRYRGAGLTNKKRIKEELDAAYRNLRDIGKRSEAVVSLGNQVYLAGYFKRRILPLMLVAVLTTTVGIGLFAWAANPGASPIASLRGSDLSGVDLTGADLRQLDLSEVDLSGANLTGADLRGASLEGAVLLDVTWLSTTCPDGTNSDVVGGSCVNHLGP